MIPVLRPIKLSFEYIIACFKLVNVENRVTIEEGNFNLVNFNSIFGEELSLELGISLGAGRREHPLVININHDVGLNS